MDLVVDKNLHNLCTAVAHLLWRIRYVRNISVATICGRQINLPTRVINTDTDDSIGFAVVGKDQWIVLCADVIYRLVMDIHCLDKIGTLQHDAERYNQMLQMIIIEANSYDRTSTQIDQFIRNLHLNRE